MKKIFTLLTFFTALLAFGSPTGELPVENGCTTGTNVGFVTLTCTATPQNLGQAGTGSYRTMNLVLGNSYIFDDTTGWGGYVTISNTTGSAILASGTMPFTYTPAVAGQVRVYLHTNSNCGTDGNFRTLTVQCIQPTCTQPSGLVINAVTSNSATISWTATNQVTTEYEYYYAYDTTTIPPENPDSVNGTTLTIGDLGPNTTYHYWIRSRCGAVNSAYTYGGTFKTLVEFTCNGAKHGMMPLTTFTPQYTGHNEIITLEGYAGQFSKVNIQSNKHYIFSSSNSTDFITITNEAGTVSYASGQTPLSWASGSRTGVIRYYTHLNGNFCSSEALERFRFITATDTAITCIPPTYLTAESISNTSVRLDWVPPTPNYGATLYYFNTTNVPPTASTPGTGGISVGNADIHNLTPGATYYWWLKTYCGPGDESIWTYGGSFSLARTTCFYPWDIYITNLTATSVSYNWTQWVSEGAPSYDFYYSTSSMAPNAGTAPLYSTNSPNESGTINGLVPGTKYYCWIRTDCGGVKSNWVYTTFITPGASACAVPTNVTSGSVNANGATLSWNAPTPAPASYDIYYSTSSAAPGTSAAATTTSNTPGKVVGGLTTNATYYFCVRSNCGTTKSAWVAGGSFTTGASSGFCNTAEYPMYPDVAITPACSGSAQIIVSDAYASEYSSINIVANRQYTFSSSVNSDYITITNATGTTLYANGTTPLVWQSGSNIGSIRYYIHTNASCGSSDIERIKRITCTASSSGSCGTAAGFAVSNVTSNSALFIWAVPATAPSGYQVYVNNASTAPSASISATANVITNDYLFTSTLTGNITYYYWIRSVCGTTPTAWVAGGNFTTNASVPCNGAGYGLWPEENYMPSCSGSNETINTDAFAGEYTNVNILPNKKYTFTSSVTTDYITVTTTTGTVLATGVTPVVWNSTTATGVVRYHLHRNASCAIQDTQRTRRIRCEAALGTDDESIAGLVTYPNPVTDVLSIAYTDVITNVAITNMLGQKLYDKAVNTNETQVDFSNYAAGIYHVRILAGGKTQTMKVVKK